jgi:hypothetical protein
MSYYQVLADGTRVFVESDAKHNTFTETLSADATLTADDSGKTFILDNATGETITLPALADGLIFHFVVGAVFATDNWIIDSAEGDNINGFISSMGATPAAVIAAAEDQINFVATAESIGDWITLTADSGNSQWIVEGACAVDGGITATDPS